MTMLLDIPEVHVSFEFKETKDQISLRNFNEFIRDLNLLYEFIALNYYDQYKSYDYYPYFIDKRGFRLWYTYNERPMESIYEAILAEVSHNSPLKLKKIIKITGHVYGVIWGLIEAYEKIDRWAIEKEKTKLEIKNLQLDNQLKQVELDKQLDTQIKKDTLASIVDRLNKSDFVAEKITITINSNSGQQKIEVK